MGHYVYNPSATVGYLFHRDDSTAQHFVNQFYIRKYLCEFIRLAQDSQYTIEYKVSHQHQGYVENKPPVFIADHRSAFVETVLETEGLEHHWCLCSDRYHIIKAGSDIRCSNDVSSVLSDLDIMEDSETSSIGETDSSDESSMLSENSP